MSEADSELATKNNEPLMCMAGCGRNLLETGYGNVIWISKRDQGADPTRRYLDLLWLCKRCDEKMEAVCFSSGPFWTTWWEIDRLMNPLEFARWSGATTRLMSDGRISTTAAAKLTEFKSLLAQVALREPTEAEIEEYRRQLGFDDI